MVKIYFPNLSNINPEAKIGRDCVIHSHVWIGKKVKIGDNCKIQAFVFIPDLVTIGNNVFIGPHVVFTNDKHPPSKNRDEWGSTLVEDNVSIGANATIGPGLTLGEGCVIGMGAVVTKDVPPHITVVGNPAKPLRII